ncbi:VENN motif pre-toxin domain-containing protein [Aeromonas bestiarum]|uniref:VENN motif pre-toxin domain-containing protein n=1 Tax=Aeromonas bestiarum TaxID=105751 RepID=UPI00338E856C
MNKVLGGLAAVAVTGDENDVNTGADRAETVYRYNYLSHQQKAQRDKELSNCPPPSLFANSG